MLSPRIVLLIGREGDALKEIRRSLSPAYQVVVFEKLEKEVAWFKPMAVVIHHNGGPRQDVINRLARLRQFQPAVPALICSSCYEPGQWDTLPRGVKGWLSWPEGQAQLQATLNRWRSPGAGLLRRLQSVWSHLALPVKTRGGSAAASELATTTDSGPGKAGLEARFFGCWSLKAGGHCLPWMSSEMNRAMLAYMIFHHDERILRRKVIDGFWPDSSEDSARNCLNVAISSIRRYLKDNMAEAPAIHFRENAYSAALGPALYTDVHEFLRLWGHAQAMERANRPDEALNAYRRAGQLYKGEFLECITREISWVESMRSKLREVYLAVLDRLGELLV
ncbi:MAG: hypothetical protein KDC66_20785, partial [Phaeodactylibacter sp.]|nr:hypothetical protein [Phaeodactylibacter sp.]